MDERVLRDGASSYRDLEVYNTAHELGVRIHRFTMALPKYELHEVGSQLRRASKAVSALGSSNGTTITPARSIRSCRMGMEWLPLRETRTICVSKQRDGGNQS